MNMFALFLLASFIGSSAEATPILSGHYALDVTVLCQATPTFPGQILTKIADANFDPSTMTVTVNGIQTSGSLVVPSGGTAGMTAVPISYSGSYLNDDTTLTATGVTWNIQYGPQKAGIAQSYLTNGLAQVGTQNLCNGWATAIHHPAP